MTWHTDDRKLYWEQRRLDAQQAEAKRALDEKNKGEDRATGGQS